ncbi:MAG: hypothetical protein LBR54_04985 [Oscillospiraceae bacterium]|nr:hypothetical protein [Oscillospiraceae bacterium]
MGLNLFVLELPQHIMFVIISVCFFLLQLLTTKRKYNILMLIAVPLTLFVYACDTNLTFYGLGIAELVLLVITFILMSAENRKAKKLKDELEAQAALQSGPLPEYAGAGSAEPIEFNGGGDEFYAADEFVFDESDADGWEQ